MQTTINKINNKVLLHHTGSYTQYPAVNHNGKEYVCVCVCVCIHICTCIYIKLNHFAVHQKLTQHCKLTFSFFFNAHYRNILPVYCEDIRKFLSSFHKHPLHPCASPERSCDESM